jgi:hypothetical protein
VNKNSDRKFVRSADIKFKVDNVPQSTYAIENAVAKFGGFVTYTSLQSTVSEKNDIKISQDSTLEIIKYHVANNITIRVPNTRLDTVIKLITKQIDFLDYRIIKADDVSLQLFANQMAADRIRKSGKRLEKAITEKGRKLETIADSENDLDSKKEQHDLKELDNLSLADQVNFSTLTLQIYQKETIKREMTANEKKFDAYRPHLGLKLIEGLKSGWYLLEGIIAFVAQLWSVILLVFIVFITFRRYGKKKHD